METKPDERFVKPKLSTRVMRRPEFGALIGALSIFVLFAYFDQSGQFVKLGGIARWTDVAATEGIMAVVVALLMIGGEFDLSAGVMVGSSGLVLGLLFLKFQLNYHKSMNYILLFYNVYDEQLVITKNQQ